MNIGIEKRLRASVGMDAIHGDSFERSVCGKQMVEAAAEIERLKAAISEQAGLVASSQAAIPDPCEWIQDEWDNSYDTSCGNKYEIIDGTPEHNGMNYCTYCGGKLETITGDATRAETRTRRAHNEH